MRLQEKLDEYKAGFRKKAPQEAQDIMAKATRELVESGQAEEALGQGDRLPDFELPSAQGQTVRSQDLLAKGPLVLTVYRGVW